MNRILERNLTAFEKFRPGLFQRLKAALERVPSTNFESAVSTRSYSQGFGEIDDRALIFMLGFGSREDLLALVRRRTAFQGAIIIVENDPLEFVRISHQFDFSELVKDQNFYVLVTEHNGELPGILRDMLVTYNTISSNLAVLKPVSSPDYYGYCVQIEILIQQVRELANVWVGTSIDDTLLGLRNSIENADHCAMSPGFGVLRDQFRGLTAISVASGPALNQALPFLKRHRDEFVLIACDSALRPLMNAGIMPDFVTALEREEIVTSYFRGVSVDPLTTLIGPHVMLKSTFDAFQGKKAIYSHGAAIGVALGYHHLGEPLMTGFSAGNLNISAATQMGFSKVVLVGHNLGHEVGSGASHAQGVTLEHRSSPKSEEELKKLGVTLRVTSQDGLSEVPTDGLYLIYRNQIEEEIAHYTNRKFYNTAMKGAKITGAITATLEEALGENDRHGPEVKARLGRLLASVSDSEFSKRREAISDRCIRLLELLRPFSRQVEIHLQSIYRARQKFSRGRLNSNLLAEASKLMQTLDTFRGGQHLPQIMQYIPFTVMQPGITPLEREISTLNAKYKNNEDLILEYLNLVEKILKIYMGTLPRIIKKLKELELPSKLVTGPNTPPVNQAETYH